MFNVNCLIPTAISKHSSSENIFRIFLFLTISGLYTERRVIISTHSKCSYNLYIKQDTFKCIFYSWGKFEKTVFALEVRDWFAIIVWEIFGEECWFPPRWNRHDIHWYSEAAAWAGFQQMSAISAQATWPINSLFTKYMAVNDKPSLDDFVLL